MKTVSVMLIGLLFAPLLTAEEAYRTANITREVYDKSDTAFNDSLRVRTATMLAGAARVYPKEMQNRNLTLTKLIGVALNLDPENASANLANSMLKRGIQPDPDKTYKLTNDQLAAGLLNVATTLRKTARGSDLNLAGYLLSLADTLKPNDQNIISQIDIYERRQKLPSWDFATSDSFQATKAAASGEITKDTPEGYQNKNKDVMIAQAKINGLVVMKLGTGMMVGRTSEIIATYKKGDRSVIEFVRPVGQQMHTSMVEAKRAMQVRYPKVTPGKFELSFDDKYTGKDGGSAGSTITVLLLSMLEGIELSEDFAMTGDVTVDWEVRRVGGIRDKIRGAKLAGCRSVAIPAENERQLQEMALMDTADRFWEIQIFTAKTVTEAMEIARKNKSPKIAEAMKRFSNIQKYLASKKAMRLPYIDNLAKELRAILALTPNHASAKYLLYMMRPPRGATVTLNTSLQKLYEISGSLMADMSPVDHWRAAYASKQVDPKEAVKQLKAIQPRLHKDALPFQAAMIRCIINDDKFNKMREDNPGAVPREIYEELVDAQNKANETRRAFANLVQGIRSNQKLLETLINE